MPLKGVDEEIEVSKVPFVIGSSPDADLVIATLAPEHLVIDRRGDAYFVHVREPGVKHNGQELLGEVMLVDGDTLSFLGGKIEVLSTAGEGEDAGATQILTLDELSLPYLKVLSGSEAGKIIHLAASGVLGRDSGVDYQVRDPYISRRHIRITVLPEGVEVEDIGGRNPVLVNGKPIKGRVRLHSGDKIQIGLTTFLFVDPSEKTEEELEAERKGRVPVWVYAVLGALALIILGGGIFLFFQGRASAYQNSITQGKASFNAAAQLKGTLDKVHEYQRAQEAFKKALSVKKTPEAEEWFQRAGKYLEAWRQVAKAETLIANGDYQGALDLLEGLLERPELADDEYVASLYDQVLKSQMVYESYRQAAALYMAGKLKEASEVLASALDIAPENPDLLALKELIAKGPPKKAEKPEEVQRKLREIATKKRKARAAKKKTELASKTTSIGLPSPEPKIDLGSKLPTPEKMGKPSVSLSSKLPNVSEIDISAKSPLTSTGPVISLDRKLDKLSELRRAYRSEHNVNKAYRLAKQILKEDPRNTQAKFYLRLCDYERKALAYEKKGLKSKARKYWKKILALDPNNKWAKEGLRRTSE